MTRLDADVFERRGRQPPAHLPAQPADADGAVSARTTWWSSTPDVPRRCGPGRGSIASVQLGTVAIDAARSLHPEGRRGRAGRAAPHRCLSVSARRICGSRRMSDWVGAHRSPRLHDDMKYGALRAQGIEVVERVAAPTRSCRRTRTWRSRPRRPPATMPASARVPGPGRHRQPLSRPLHP